MLNHSILILELGIRMILKDYKGWCKIVSIDHSCTHGKHAKELKVIHEKISELKSLLFVVK